MEHHPPFHMAHPFPGPSPIPGGMYAPEEQHPPLSINQLPVMLNPNPGSNGQHRNQQFNSNHLYLFVIIVCFC